MRIRNSHGLSFRPTRSQPVRMPQKVLLGVWQLDVGYVFAVPVPDMEELRSKR